MDGDVQRLVEANLKVFSDEELFEEFEDLLGEGPADWLKYAGERGKAFLSRNADLLGAAVGSASAHGRYERKMLAHKLWKAWRQYSARANITQTPENVEKFLQDLGLKEKPAAPSAADPDQWKYQNPKAYRIFASLEKGLLKIREIDKRRSTGSGRIHILASPGLSWEEYYRNRLGKAADEQEQFQFFMRQMAKVRKKYRIDPTNAGFPRAIVLEAFEDFDIADILFEADPPKLKTGQRAAKKSLDDDDEPHFGSDFKIKHGQRHAKNSLKGDDEPHFGSDMRMPRTGKRFAQNSLRGDDEPRLGTSTADISGGRTEPTFGHGRPDLSTDADAARASLAGDNEPYFGRRTAPSSPTTSASPGAAAPKPMPDGGFLRQPTSPADPMMRGAPAGDAPSGKPSFADRKAAVGDVDLPRADRNPRLAAAKNAVPDNAIKPPRGPSFLDRNPAPDDAPAPRKPKYTDRHPLPEPLGGPSSRSDLEIGDHKPIPNSPFLRQPTSANAPMTNLGAGASTAPKPIPNQSFLRQPTSVNSPMRNPGTPPVAPTAKPSSTAGGDSSSPGTEPSGRAALAPAKPGTGTPSASPSAPAPKPAPPAAGGSGSGSGGSGRPPRASAAPASGGGGGRGAGSSGPAPSASPSGGTGSRSAAAPAAPSASGGASTPAAAGGSGAAGGGTPASGALSNQQVFDMFMDVAAKHLGDLKNGDNIPDGTSRDGSGGSSAGAVPAPAVSGKAGGGAPAVGSSPHGHTIDAAAVSNLLRGLASPSEIEDWIRRAHGARPDRLLSGASDADKKFLALFGAAALAATKGS